MLIPRAHWHQHIGRPVVVHSRFGNYCGQMQNITNSHVLLHGYKLASADKEDDGSITTLDQCPTLSATNVYFPGAALAIPLFAIAGITAIALAPWW